jgi:tetratricopeptide (TPR) repeat protein
MLAMILSVSSCGAQEASTDDRRKDVSGSNIRQDIPDPRPPDPQTPRPPTPKYDFTDSSHWNLTVSAWEQLSQKDYDGVFAYGRKCQELYEEKAKAMAATMKSFTGFGHEDDFALVNDVATSHYIMGEALMKMGRPEEALKEFEYVIQTYPYAQCWDPKGWFWKVAEVSRINIEKITKAKKDGQLI